MKKNQNAIADEIVQGLTEFAEALEAGDDLGEKFTCHRVVLDLRPEPYTPEKVKATREKTRALSRPWWPQRVCGTRPTTRSSVPAATSISSDNRSAQCSVSDLNGV